MHHPMLLEGSIHHFDMLRYLTGSEVIRVAASESNPPESSFSDGAIVDCILECDSGFYASYHADLLAAGSENRWHHESYRIDFRNGAIECDGWTVKLLRDGFVKDVDIKGDPSARNGHNQIIEQFISWVNGDSEAETSLRDNLKSASVVVAAVEAVESGNWVEVRS